MNMFLHSQINNNKLRTMGTFLVPILVTLAFFGFSYFLLPWVRSQDTIIKWGEVSFSPWVSFISLVEAVIIFGIIFIFLYKNEKILPKDVGLIWSVGQGGFKQVLDLNAKIILFLFLISVVGLNLTQYFWGPKIIKKSIYLLHNWHTGKAKLDLMAPLFEEILFRGIYCTLFIRYGFKWRDAILITGIAFGFLHLLVYQKYILAYAIEISFATVVGWFLGWIFYKTRTLVMPILWHYAINGFIFFAVLRPDLLKKFADFVIV